MRKTLTIEDVKGNVNVIFVDQITELEFDNKHVLITINTNNNQYIIDNYFKVFQDIFNFIQEEKIFGNNNLKVYSSNSQEDIYAKLADEHIKKDECSCECCTCKEEPQDGECNNESVENEIEGEIVEETEPISDPLSTETEEVNIKDYTKPSYLKIQRERSQLLKKYERYNLAELLSAPGVTEQDFLDANALITRIENYN